MKNFTLLAEQIIDELSPLEEGMIDSIKSTLTKLLKPFRSKKEIVYNTINEISNILESDFQFDMFVKQAESGKPTNNYSRTFIRRKVFNKIGASPELIDGIINVMIGGYKDGDNVRLIKTRTTKILNDIL